MNKKNIDLAINIALGALVVFAIFAIVWPLFLGALILAAIAWCGWFVYKLVADSTAPNPKATPTSKSESVPTKKGWDMNTVEEAEIA